MASSKRRRDRRAQAKAKSNSLAANIETRADGRPVTDEDLPEIDPSLPSSDYMHNIEYWQTATAILGGVKTMRAVAKDMDFLPRYPLESDEDYEYRVKTAPFTNIFADIVGNLAQKPFAKEIALGDKASPALTELIEDIDGRGNHLNTFAANTFYHGIAKSLEWILVDHPVVPAGLTVAQEKALNAKPYWVRCPAERVIAAYSDIIDGKEQWVHVRILEPRIERVGFEEVVVEYVRVYDRPQIVQVDPETRVETVVYGPAQWVLYRKDEQIVRGKKRIFWVIEDSGPISIGVIPLVAFIVGRREGDTWRVLPEMNDVADMQIEHFQQETNLKAVKMTSCFPMVSANGVAPPKDDQGNILPAPLGPGAMLYAPPAREGVTGSYSLMEPAATSLTFLAGDLKSIEQRMRERGRQPLTADSGNLTVVTTQFAAQKGNSAVQAWALNLKDALEQAFVLTSLWLNEDPSAEVQVYTDFGVEGMDGGTMDQVLKMREDGDLPQEDLWEEAKRRGVLRAEFDADAAKKKLAAEAPQDPLESDTADSLLPGQRPPANSNGPQPGKVAA